MAGLYMLKGLIGYFCFQVRISNLYLRRVLHVARSTQLNENSFHVRCCPVFIFYLTRVYPTCLAEVFVGQAAAERERAWTPHDIINFIIPCRVSNNSVDYYHFRYQACSETLMQMLTLISISNKKQRTHLIKLTRLLVTKCQYFPIN